jgi:hypothetical protein
MFFRIINLFLIIFIVAINVAIYFYLENLSLIIGCSLFVNIVLLLTVGKYILSYVLFPYSNSIMKYFYSFTMNKKMIEEIKKSFKFGQEIIRTKMNVKKFILLQNF